MNVNQPYILNSEAGSELPRYREFDSSRIKLLPLSDRLHDLTLKNISPVTSSDFVPSVFQIIGERIAQAVNQNASVILMMGAHVLRAGMQRYLIDMMERGLISCIAINGAGVIHDYEFSMIGATTESVQHYIKDGRFGLWKETGIINDIVAEAAEKKMGLGEAVGKALNEGNTPYKEISILAAAYRLGVPVTVHVGIGYDIIHQFPNFCGSAYGETSYRDFLRFTHVMESLENGVIMNFGSAVMAPEVYLKALSMVRNAAQQDGRVIKHFATLVCDLVELPEDFKTVPDRSQPGYYFRPWKTMLVRTVNEGGESFYVRDDHRNTIQQLWSACDGTNNG